MNWGRTRQERAMVAAAMTAAHYLDAALKAGMDGAAIESVLARIVRRSGMTEFWITDETGRIVYGSEPMDFVFPSDPDTGTQAAVFTALLCGCETTVIQEPQPREEDGAPFQYVGVAGVDKPRIVQIGLAGPGEASA
jgi:hypothetical protein